jgi:iron complex outermembrane receptor protein
MWISANFSRSLLWTAVTVAGLMLNGPVQAQRAVLVGTVLDDVRRVPLVGANVVVENTALGASTDAKGRFVIRGIPAGTWSIRVTMMGYAPVRRTVHLAAGEIARLEVFLREDVIGLNPVSVIATRSEEESMRSPVSLAVMEDVELRRKAYRSVVEALNYLPSALFIGNQLNIRNSSGFMYGAGTRVLFLVDGIPVHASDTGEINWDLIPFFDIERIEVIKGPASFLYGANALGGAVNIVTRKPRERKRLLVRADAGIYDDPYYPEWKWTNRVRHFDRVDVSYSKRWKRFGLQVALRRDASTGFMQAGYHLLYSFSAKAVVAFTPDRELTLYTAYMQGRRGEFVMWRDQKHALVAPDPEAASNMVKAKHLYFYGKYRQVMSPTFSWTVRFSYNSLLLGNQYNRPGEFFPAVGPGIELSGLWVPSIHHRLVFGLEYRQERANNKWMGRHSAHNIGPFMQHEWRPWPTLTVIAGVRGDFYRLDKLPEERTYSPRVGLNWAVRENWSLRASVGWGYRPPTIAERFVRFSVAGFEVMPNPGLLAEKARSVELGTRLVLRSSWVADLALFQSDYWNMIEPYIDITSNSIRFLNVARPRIRGIDFSLKASGFAGHLGGEVQFLLTEHEDMKTGLPLYYRPRRIVRFLPWIRIGPARLQVEYHYASRSERVQVFPLDERVPMHLWNVRFDVALGTYAFALVVHNLLNYNYTLRERKLEPIRNISLSIRSTF